MRPINVYGILNFTMKLNVLVCVCPACNTTFTLKGSKLRRWFDKVEKKPTIQGPYCNYKCSSRANQARIVARYWLLKESKETALLKNLR
jgi:hypothetical protein